MPRQDFYTSFLSFIKSLSGGYKWHNAHEWADSPFEAVEWQHHKGCVQLIEIDRFVQADCSLGFFQRLSDDFWAKGILLIHLWEDVWHYKTQVVQSRISALLGNTTRVHARMCEVRRINQPTAVAFLLANHLQVPTNAKWKYGLFIKPNYQDRYAGVCNQNDGLVAVATFGATRGIERNGVAYRSCELIRFTNLQGVTVVGGLGKLLQAFINEHQPDDVMTYADRDWSAGRSYEQLGFQEIGQTSPQIFYVDASTHQRYYPHRMGLTQESYYIKVFNAGNLKYLLDLKKLCAK